jgi:hypothetical protein
MRRSLWVLTLAAPAAALVPVGPLLAPASLRRLGLRGGAGAVAMAAANAQSKSKALLTKKLGSSDVRVSAVCLGTMTFGVQNTGECAGRQPPAPADGVRPDC